MDTNEMIVNRCMNNMRLVIVQQSLNIYLNTVELDYFVIARLCTAA